MNTKIFFRVTDADGHTNDEIFTIVTDGIYDFGDYLADNGVNFDYDDISDCYYAVDYDGDRTGECWQIIRTEMTDDDFYG